MNSAITFICDGEPLVLKKLSEVPGVGDEVEIGKTTSPKRYVVLSRVWRDSMDDWTRVDVVLEEVKTTSTKGKRKST